MSHAPSLHSHVPPLHPQDPDLLGHDHVSQAQDQSVLPQAQAIHVLHIPHAHAFLLHGHHAGQNFRHPGPRMRTASDPRVTITSGGMIHGALHAKIMIDNAMSAQYLTNNLHHDRSMIQEIISLKVAIHHRATSGKKERKGSKSVAAEPSSAIHSLHQPNFSIPNIINTSHAMIRIPHSALPHRPEQQFKGFFMLKNNK